MNVGKKVIALGAFAVAGQLAVVCTLPALSRIYDPSVYGVYVIFVGLYSILSVFAGLRYDSAIVLPRSDGVAVSLSAVVGILGVVMALLLALATRVCPDCLRPVGVLPPDAAHFGYALATATAVGSVQRVCVSWCTRRRQFTLMGIGQLVFTVVSVGVQLGIGVFSPRLGTLVWGHVIGLAGQCCCIGLPLALEGARARSTVPGWRPLRVAAARYRRFPLYMVGYAFASSLRDRLVQLVLGAGAGAAVVGKFGLSWRVMNAPNSLLYGAISPVFYSLASRRDRNSISDVAGRLVEVGFVLLIVPFIAVAIEAPEISNGLLGAKWAGTGPYLQALAAPAVLLAATCWLDRLFDAFGRQGVALGLEACFTVLSVGTLLVLARVFSGVQLAWTFALLSAAYYWTYAFVAFRACGLPLAGLLRASRVGCATLVAALFGGLALRLLTPLPLRLAGYGLLAAVLFAAWFAFLGGRETVRQVIRSDAVPNPL